MPITRKGDGPAEREGRSATSSLAVRKKVSAADEAANLDLLSLVESLPLKLREGFENEAAGKVHGDTVQPCHCLNAQNVVEDISREGRRFHAKRIITSSKSYTVHQTTEGRKRREQKWKPAQFWPPHLQMCRAAVQI